MILQAARFDLVLIPLRVITHCYAIKPHVYSFIHLFIYSFAFLVSCGTKVYNYRIHVFVSYDLERRYCGCL